MFFWVIFSILILFATWNVLTDDWLVTPELGVLSVLLILLAAVKRVASSHRWEAVAVLMGTLALTAVVLRLLVWQREYPAVDGRVLFLLGLTLVAIMGRAGRALRRRRRRMSRDS